jgi:hypothetical protein
LTQWLLDHGPRILAILIAMATFFRLSRILEAKFVSMIPYLPDELQVVAMNVKDPGKVTDLIASNLNVSLDEKQELLATLDVRKRLERLTSILNREIELLELGQKIQSQVQDELSKNQKDFYLRQQMRAIQNELGEKAPEKAEVEELRRRLAEAPEGKRRSLLAMFCVVWGIGRLDCPDAAADTTPEGVLHPADPNLISHSRLMYGNLL